MKNTIAIITSLVIAGCSSMQVAGKVTAVGCTTSAGGCTQGCTIEYKFALTQKRDPLTQI